MTIARQPWYFDSNTSELKDADGSLVATFVNWQDGEYVVAAPAVLEALKKEHTEELSVQEEDFNNQMSGLEEERDQLNEKAISLENKIEDLENEIAELREALNNKQ